MARRIKHAIVWTRLQGEYSHIEIGLRHVGPGLVFAWLRQIEALKNMELERILEYRSSRPTLTQELRPDLFPATVKDIKTTTPEGFAADRDFHRSVANQCGLALRFDDVSISGEAAIDEVEDLGLLEACFALAMAAQQLKATDPLDQGDRVSPPGGLSVGDRPEPGV